jgi:hypothetical protein
VEQPQEKIDALPAASLQFHPNRYTFIESTTRLLGGIQFAVDDSGSLLNRLRLNAT